MPCDEPAGGRGCVAQGAARHVCGTQQVTPALQVHPPAMAPPASRYEGELFLVAWLCLLHDHMLILTKPYARKDKIQASGKAAECPC